MAMIQRKLEFHLTYLVLSFHYGRRNALRRNKMKLFLPSMVYTKTLCSCMLISTIWLKRFYHYISNKRRKRQEKKADLQKSALYVALVKRRSFL